jgi:hypothetical protein
MKNRTWLHKKPVSDSILYCDAFLILRTPHHYLVLDWTDTSKRRVALDGYLITPTALVPVWDASAITGIEQYWSALNAPIMQRVHQTVIRETQADVAWRLGYLGVSLLCHYVRVWDVEPLTGVNKYRQPLKRPKPANP